MQIKVYTIDVKVPRWLKRFLIGVAIPSVVFFGYRAAVRATVSNPISNNQVLTAAALNTPFNDLQSQISTINSALSSGSGVSASKLVTPFNVSGSVSTAGVPATIQTGTYAVTTASGTARITYPKPFGTGIFSIIAVCGSGNGARADIRVYDNAFNSLTGFDVEITNAQSTGTRINWIAIGY